MSPETKRGAEKCNEIRKQNHLKQLQIYTIPLIEVTEITPEMEAKVSSSNQRMKILGTQFKEPFERPNLPKSPYIIGLIGGIASGKSKMVSRFESMGAKIIDCDKLAHEVYEPGQDCYRLIVKAFGEDVVGADGKIDRKILGEKVFGNPENLTKLNQIVWPILLERVKKTIKRLHEKEKAEIVILEAAVLLQAGWESEVHEIWSCIISPQEAIKRVVERNNLTEEQARKRLEAQPSNAEILLKSNVVFSSLWSYDFSQLQAEKAWRELNERLSKMK